MGTYSEVQGVPKVERIVSVVVGSVHVFFDKWSQLGPQCFVPVAPCSGSGKGSEFVQKQLQTPLSRGIGDDFSVEGVGSELKRRPRRPVDVEPVHPEGIVSVVRNELDEAAGGVLVQVKVILIERVVVPVARGDLPCEPF